MKRNIIVAILLTFCSIFSAQAVLQEQNINQTVAVLRTELQQKCVEQDSFMKQYNKMNEEQHKQILDAMQKSNQIALMLYSQQNDYTFNLAYACHEATEQYKSFKKNNAPHTQVKTYLATEISRYESLITSLKNLSPRIKSANDTTPRPSANMIKSFKKEFSKMKRDTSFMLSQQARVDRDSCIAYANTLLENLNNLKESVEADEEHYEFVVKRLGKSNDFAKVKYEEMQQTIFKNGETSYFKILMALPYYAPYAWKEFKDKYYNTKYTNVKSGWRGSIIFGFIFVVSFYLIIASILSFFIVKKIIPRLIRRSRNRFIDKETFESIEFCIGMVIGVIIFAISIMIAKQKMEYHFILMASSLLIEFAWLLGVCMLSLLIRLETSQLKEGYKLYSPIILMAFIIIVFRIMFIPNTLINLTFPLILLIFTIWQGCLMRKKVKKLQKTDSVYAHVSLAIMITSCIMAWFGYTMMSVQVFIWWIFQLTCIQTITTVHDLMSNYEKNVVCKKILLDLARKKKKAFEELSTDKRKKFNITIDRNLDLYGKKNFGKYITKTWIFDFFKMCLLPVAATMSVIFSIGWAADLFNLTELCKDIYFFNFINIEGVIQLSIFKITIVIALYFIFRYLKYLINASFEYHAQKLKNGQANIGLFQNIVSIIIWGLFFILVLIILQVPKSGISIVSAGLATGIGFAMKDILENIFYGISLMSGRIKYGEWIECDGIRGKVVGIGYQSTEIRTTDKCVISFLNSNLFTKNFKNLSRDYNYELLKVPFGVAYGTNVQVVRNLLSKEILSLSSISEDTHKQTIDLNKGVSILMDDMADSSVNLIAVLWISVADRFSLTAKIKERIYEVLNENNIEIPFPQRDIHIINNNK